MMTLSFKILAENKIYSLLKKLLPCPYTCIMNLGKIGPLWKSKPIKTQTDFFYKYSVFKGKSRLEIGSTVHV